MNFKLFGFIINLYFTAAIATREYFNTTEGSVAKVTEGNVIFHSFRQPETENTFTVNIVELQNTLVVFDFGIIVEDARKAARYVQSLNKPTIICILTHNHVDHFGGYLAFKDICQQTYTINETISIVRNISQAGNDFSEAAQAFVNAAMPLKTGIYNIEGERFIFERLIGIETEFALLTRMPKQQAIFAGDSVFAGNSHFFLADNHNIKTWLDYYAKLKYYRYRNVFIGHGHPRDWSTDSEYKKGVEYLNFVRNVANTYKPEKEYVQQILNKYPNRILSVVVPCQYNCPV